MIMMEGNLDLYWNKNSSLTVLLDWSLITVANTRLLWPTLRDSWLSYCTKSFGKIFRKMYISKTQYATPTAGIKNYKW